MDPTRVRLKTERKKVLKAEEDKAPGGSTN